MEGSISVRYQHPMRSIRFRLIAELALVTHDPAQQVVKRVKILVDDDDEKEVHEYKLEDLETIKKKQKKKNNNNGNGKKNSQEDQEIKELEALEKKEKQEGKSKLGDN